MTDPGRSYLDTHVVVWLYEPVLDALSLRAREVIESDELRVSPVVALELELLHEIGRLTTGGIQIIGSLEAQGVVRTCDLDFRHVVEAAQTMTWTRDPFDRLIAGQARAGGGKLLTRDQRIREAFTDAVW